MFNLVENMLEKKYMKKFVFLTMLFGLMIIVTNDVSAQTCNPNDDQIAVYHDLNYKGNCKVLDIADYVSYAKRADLPPGPVTNMPDNVISSVKLGKNVKAVICEHSNFGGICESLRTSVVDLSKTHLGEDKATSIKVYKKGGDVELTLLSQEENREFDIFERDSKGTNWIGRISKSKPGNESKVTLTTQANATILLMKNDDRAKRTQDFFGTELKLDASPRQQGIIYASGAEGADTIKKNKILDDNGLTQKCIDVLKTMGQVWNGLPMRNNTQNQSYSCRGIKLAKK